MTRKVEQDKTSTDSRQHPHCCWDHGRRQKRSLREFLSMRTFLVSPFLSLCIVFGQTPEPASPPVALMPSHQDRARGLLEDSLKDKNPDTRKHAVQALGLVSPREPYLSQLEAMLGDKDVEVRLATITSLVDLKNKRT